MQIPIGMILLSKVLSEKSNRWVNIIAGTIVTLVQVATLFVVSPTNYYIFAVPLKLQLLFQWLFWLLDGNLMQKTSQNRG